MEAWDNAGMFSKEFFPGLDTIINTSAVWSTYYIHNMYDSLEVGFFFVSFVLGAPVIADFCRGFEIAFG